MGQKPPLYAPLPNRAGNERGHSTAPIKRPPAFHTGKTASPAGTRAHYAVKGLSPLSTTDTPLTFKNGGFQSILGSDYRGMGTFLFSIINKHSLGAGFAGPNGLDPRSSCLSDCHPSPLECQGALATPGPDSSKAWLPAHPQ